MHVDEYIDHYDGDAYAQWMFLHFRLSAMLKMRFQPFMKDRKLFATWKGKRYRVTGASRLGDVWLAKDFAKDIGYDHRVDLEECSEWGAEP